jgi:beta-glucosidase
MKFPEGFAWGAASAAYQIEGGWNSDGKGRSIWDDFAHTPGKIKTGETGDVACDSYRRWPEDLGLIRSMGLRAYRFSISWPRVQPGGRGALNEKGLDYYKRMLDDVHGAGAEPFVTLYHWDLPSELQGSGGWLSRDTAKAFAEYSFAVANALGSRVPNWITLNEPWVITLCGHALGSHAPGLVLPFRALEVAHHLLLAHGLAVAALRQAVPGAKVGLVNALQPVDDRRLDSRGSSYLRRADDVMNRVWMDPVFGKGYPESLRPFMARKRGLVREGDLETIAAPIDFLGVNNYSRSIVKPRLAPLYRFDTVRAGYRDARFTAMGWERYPEGLYRVLARIRDEYGNPPVYVTENGVALREAPGEDGVVHDPERVAFLRDYVAAAWRAIQDGCDLRGYFVWSLTDNLEWAEGTAMTFGLAHVDFEGGTLNRTLKDSALWYRDLIAANGL